MLEVHVKLFHVGEEKACHFEQVVFKQRAQAWGEASCGGRGRGEESIQSRRNSMLSSPEAGHGLECSRNWMRPMATAWPAKRWPIGRSRAGEGNKDGSRRTLVGNCIPGTISSLVLVPPHYNFNHYLALRTNWLPSNFAGVPRTMSSKN